MIPTVTVVYRPAADYKLAAMGVAGVVDYKPVAVVQAFPARLLPVLTICHI
jgi:hypothetical protein